MTLLNPLALAFAALVPLIVILYLLKLRRQPARVSTLMFWQRVVADNRRRALFQRLRQVLSLLLHLLIFGLLLFALARPELRSFRGAEAGLSTVVIIDARARMQARTADGGTRFAQAQRMAESFLRRASSRQPVALLAEEGAAARVVVGMSGEERTLLDGLDTVQPTDAGGRIEDAVTLAAELLAARPGGHRIILLTDHAPELPATLAASGEVETRIVGDGDAARENVGITRLTARALPNSPETYEVLIEIENFGAHRQAGSVELAFEGRLFDVKPFDLAPGERRADVYPALAARTGIANPRGWLTAHLDLADKSADAFPLDDDAFAVVPPPHPAHVLLVTKSNWFLESLLRADDQITFDQLAPDAFQPGQATGFDVVALDDFLPAGFDVPKRLPKQGNFLFLRRAPFPVADPAELEHPVITDVDATSPLLRLVNLRDATVLRAQSWVLPETASGSEIGDAWRYATPVRSLEHPLVISGERGHTQRMVAVAFGAADSDLPLHVAFPLFVHNAVSWLAGREGAADAAEIRAGETIRLAAGESLWTRPQRDYQPVGEIPAGERQTGPGVFQPLRDGFYLRLGPGGVNTWLAVNTSDRAMSALNIPHPDAGTRATVDSVPATGSAWEAVRIWPPWVYLALAGFVLCALEWCGVSTVGGRSRRFLPCHPRLARIQRTLDAFHELIEVVRLRQEARRLPLEDVFRLHVQAVSAGNEHPHIRVNGPQTLETLRAAHFGASSSPSGSGRPSHPHGDTARWPPRRCSR